MRRKNTTKQMMKEYISESLLLLMQSERYDNISIADITNKAGVNRSTYYRNFSSKEEIIEFYLEQIMNRYLNEYNGIENKTFKTYLYTLFKHFYSYKSSLLLIHGNNLSFLLLQVLNQFFKQSQLYKSQINQERFRLFYHIGGIYNFFILWLSHNMQETPNELAVIASAMFQTDKTPVLFE